MQTMILDSSTFRAAIFDMDGTMVANMECHKQTWQAFMKRHHLELSDEEFKKKVSGKKNDEIFPLLFDKKLTQEELNAYAEEKEAMYRELYAPQIAEVAGLTDFLQQLRAKGTTCAIATTAPEKNREQVFHALHIRDYFAVVVGDEDTKKGKPDPEIYHTTARALGVEPSQCIVFEDSPVGVKAATAAGMKVIGICTHGTPDELHEASAVVENFSSITLV